MSFNQEFNFPVLQCEYCSHNYSPSENAFCPDCDNKNPTYLEIHPLADIFPMMSEQEFNSLCEDINANGQLEPIWVYENKIIDGRNRYNACQTIGAEPITREWTGEESELVKFVISLNLHRRHLNESQRAMVAAKLATMRQGERIDLSEISERLSQPQAANLLNVSSDLVGFARKVQQNAAPELAEKVQRGEVAVSTAALVSELPKAEQAEIVARGEKEILEASKRIRAEKAEVRRQERIERIVTEAVAPLNEIDKKFAVIYADPPWKYDFSVDSADEIENHYPTMEIEEIKLLPLSEITTTNAILFMWATSPKLEEAFGVINAWGFNYKTCAVWDKEWISMGYYFRQQHEILLIATKGSIPAPETQNRPASVLREKRSEHSRKPETFYQYIEAMYPTLPRIELFARSARQGWDVWGNQSNAAQQSS